MAFIKYIISIFKINCGCKINDLIKNIEIFIKKQGITIVLNFLAKNSKNDLYFATFKVIPDKKKNKGIWNIYSNNFHLAGVYPM